MSRIFDKLSDTEMERCQALTEKRMTVGLTREQAQERAVLCARFSRQESDWRRRQSAKV